MMMRVRKSKNRLLLLKLSHKLSNLNLIKFPRANFLQKYKMLNRVGCLTIQEAKGMTTSRGKRRQLLSHQFNHSR